MLRVAAEMIILTNVDSLLNQRIEKRDSDDLVHRCHSPYSRDTAVVASYSSWALATSDERDVDQENEEVPSLAQSGAQAFTSSLYNMANAGYISVV